MLKIHIESTKTPTIIKFVANKILTEGSFEYHSVEEVKNSTFIQQLFHLPFVKKVFVTANFIAVERFNIVEWADVQDELKGVIENYLAVNDSLFTAKTETKQVVVEVYAESTPNPAVMKFVSNKLLTSQNIEVTSLEDAKEVPLAKDLFDFPFVKEVFVSDNYISITKNNTVEWFEITTALRDFLKKYLSEAKPVITENYKPKVHEKTEIKPVATEDLDDISQEIIAILDEYIKPAVTSDGGNIMFQSYNTDSKTVSVILQGACSGCPSSTITLKNGIEATLKQLLPNKIEEVVALNG
ncbi:NifU family protein [Aureibaculum sp. 2210JD6-5]|uniref:NifU family protein n=1 Tax=Aureibaculum sp. 2210JD6-5 TaxID=3103957 RepID=UPI002AAEDAE8|nr:NifU family protein [Aureibaculum sp. 2210JD6-5]MDY7396243.1 NifU family protein [Aureibaculum sp. 2210JD6-5]